MGRRVRESCLATATQAQLGVKKATVVTLANQYMSYFTTPEEYSKQQYEGGSNLYGENTGPFIRHQLARLIEQLGNGEQPALRNHWEFAPGLKASFLRKPKPQIVERRAEELVAKNSFASFTWRDLPPGTLDLGDVLVRIELQNDAGQWRPFEHDGLPADDRGLDVEVRSLGAEKDRRGWRWRTTWWPAHPSPKKTFRFVILERAGQPTLASASFAF